MKKYITIILAALLFMGCDDFLDIHPTGKIIAETGEEYRALLTDVYSRFPEDRGLTILRGDEMAADYKSLEGLDYDSYFDVWNWTDYNRNESSYYFNWRSYYHSCYIANYIIEHKNDITKATQKEINQLVGESYMMRAYVHFLLVNLYAPAYTHCEPETTRGIPLQMKADVNAVLKCSSVEQVYRQILLDVDSAALYLNVERWDNGLNYRFNTTTANALRARTALYMGDWELALAEAKKVVAKYPDLEDLNNTRSVLPTNYNSVESIMALEQVVTAKLLNIIVPDSNLIKIHDDNDKRLGKYYTSKLNADFVRVWSFRSRTPNNERCTFRAGEFYLIAAESANELDKKDEALAYIKPLIQKRYTVEGANEYSSLLETLGQDELREEIAKERQRELAFQGLRWFDLRRTTQPELVKVYPVSETESQTFILEQGDERYTLHFPSDAVAANPGLENWKE
ncbi:MAG: RagB/SusD family nutrient uptake outer membrane protein [Bacteroidaceae bacterium]|nr:RagB/SusD family nutrient uptake outer membrane protein [Bacteroidaceae bacterium]